ncbi:MAG: citrate/2-methylcitrate synthase, partial [Candidatus Margulisbacteria bacterium]|nr:citrate/2-methylcitrate synthase [Candidatus Margulisiibacteriota bacterium]
MSNKNYNLSTAEGPYTADFAWPVELKVNKGLEGAVTNKTLIGYVDGDKGRLIYRGYSVETLAENSTFEEVAYLLIFGKLPLEAELNKFKQDLKNAREIPKKALDVLEILYDHEHSHPMSLLRTAVSVLGVLQKNTMDTSYENEIRMGMQLIACLPTLIAALSRMRTNKEVISPNNKLDYAENFLYMLHGKIPDKYDAKMFDACMTLHADHGMNASTLTAVATSASLSDLYSSIVGAIGSLKGPLHGGANEKVLNELIKIKSVDHVKEYVDTKIKNKEKIMGFGHRIYKTYDPRAAVLKKYAAKLTSESEVFQIAESLEKEVAVHYSKKGIYPNVDFYSGF